MAGDSPPRRPRRRPGENRERLIEAGIVEFGTSGYLGASTSAIAASAGVPQPHVYASFATKRQLFLACAQRIAAQLREGAPADAPMLAAFLLQALAALGDQELGPELRPMLRELRAGMGERAFTAMLEQATVRLLDGGSEDPR